MNDPGLVTIIMEQLDSTVTTCKFFKSYDKNTRNERNPLFCGPCKGRDYSCAYYTPLYAKQSVAKE